MARQCKVGPVQAGQARHGWSRLGWAWQAGFVSVGQGLARHRHGWAWLGRLGKEGKANRGTAGQAWCG